MGQPDQDATGRDHVQHEIAFGFRRHMFERQQPVVQHIQCKTCDADGLEYHGRER